MMLLTYLPNAPAQSECFIGKHKLHNEIYLLELHKNVSELPALDTW